VVGKGAKKNPSMAGEAINGVSLTILPLLASGALIDGLLWRQFGSEGVAYTILDAYLILSVD